MKYCHYFNKKPECQCEKIGCMFRHSQSKECKFEKHCHIKLCHFLHDFAEENEQEKDCCFFSYDGFEMHIKENF